MIKKIQSFYMGVISCPNGRTQTETEQGAVEIYLDLKERKQQERTKYTKGS
jgi:hypothetical protein